MIKCNLSVLMASRRYSIQDVADKTGLSRTTISALVNENGKGIQFETMNALCELFEVQPGALFHFEQLQLDIEYINHKETEPKFFSYTSIEDLSEVEKVLDNSFLITVRLNMKHNFKSFSNKIEFPFSYELDKDGVVNDVYITDLHKSIFNFFAYEGSQFINLRNQLFENEEAFIVKFLEEKLNLTTSPYMNFHY